MKIGGANASPTDATKPRKRGFGRVFAAMVWPGGHTLLVALPRFGDLPLSLADFPFSAPRFEETAFNLWF